MYNPFVLRVSFLFRLWARNIDGSSVHERGARRRSGCRSPQRQAKEVFG